jgi:ABC-type lipoprotein release transport system permease subunit
MTFSGIIELKRMAMRNLARHKLKTFLTCAAIMVSVAVYIFMQSWLDGSAQESRRNIVNYEIGAAQLQTKLYFEKKDEMPAYETFDGWEAYADALEAAGYNAAPRYSFAGTLYSLSGSAPLVVHAVDPEREARTLAYTTFIDFGRFVRRGEFAVVLGAMTAEKLGIGFPTRPEAAALEDFIKTAARSSEDEAFIRSCYEPMEVKAQYGETKAYAEERAEGRFTLRRDAGADALSRLWLLAGAAELCDARIATVIDYKMAPDAVRADKWRADLLPELDEAGRKTLDAVYQYDELTDAYLLDEDASAAAAAAALAVMLRADFSGAVRHVNQVIDVKVAGIVNSPDPATNFNAAFMPLDVLSGEDGMMLDGRVTSLLIRDKAMSAADVTSKKESAGAISAALSGGGAALPPELGVFTWQDSMSDYLAYEKYESGSSQIFSILLFFLALLGISNTMLLAILERTKEIGMMRAMGMTDGQMIFVYMTEAAFLGLLGSLLGIALGCALNYPMVKYGLDFSEMLEKMGGNMGYRISGNFRGMWSVPVIVGSGVAATALSALAAFFPTRRALKLSITNSLRFE